MRFSLSFILVLFFALNGFSQFETPKKVIKIVPIKNENAPIQISSENKIPTVIKFESSIGKNEDKQFLNGFSLLPKKEEKSMMVKEPVKSASELWSGIIVKKLENEGITQEDVSRDLFLGEFVVYTPQINVMSRDYGAVDGDVIRIWLNGEIIVNKVYMQSDFDNYVLNLNEGQNVVEIQALNTGEYFPNTGQFLFLDGNRKVVTNQSWGLASGYKAIVKIRRINGLVKEDGK